MPPENSNNLSESIGTFSWINTKTGEKFEIGAVQELINVDDTYELDKKYNMPIRNNITITFDTNENWSNAAIYNLMGIDVSKVPDQYAITYCGLVQARKHKKKRINKKWAKKYGYIMKPITTKGWKIENHTDGTFKFTK